MFIGHLKTWNYLCHEADQGHLAPSYLFCGPEGIGKKLVASTWIQFLFCKEKQRPCGTCPSCHKIISRQHPDFFFVEPQEQSSIRVDEIRELQKKIIRTPLEADSKWIVIDQASHMTVSAANSLLKTLEEPPPRTHFILIASQISQILPTIRSRSRRVSFEKPDRQLLIQHFAKEYSPEILEKYFTWADGSPGLMIQMMKAAEDSVWSTFVEKFPSRLTLSEVNADSLQKTDLKLLFQVLQKKIWNQTADPTTLSWMDRLILAERDLERNINKNLILENLIL